MNQVYSGTIKNKKYVKFPSGKSKIEFSLEQINIIIEAGGGQFSPSVNLIAWNELADQINNLNDGMLLKVETQANYKKQDPTKIKKIYKKLNNGVEEWNETDLYLNEINVKTILNDVNENIIDFDTTDIDKDLNELLDGDDVLWD